MCWQKYLCEAPLHMTLGQPRLGRWYGDLRAWVQLLGLTVRAWTWPCDTNFWVTPKWPKLRCVPYNVKHSDLANTNLIHHFRIFPYFLQEIICQGLELEAYITWMGILPRWMAAFNANSVTLSDPKSVDGDINNRRHTFVWVTQSNK